LGGGFGAEAVANFHVITLDLGQMVARNGGPVKGSGRFHFQAYSSENASNAILRIHRFGFLDQIFASFLAWVQ